jgi:hypothetical protein
MRFIPHERTRPCPFSLPPFRSVYSSLHFSCRLMQLLAMVRSSRSILVQSAERFPPTASLISSSAFLCRPSGRAVALEAASTRRCMDRAAQCRFLRLALHAGSAVSGHGLHRPWHERRLPHPQHLGSCRERVRQTPGNGVDLRWRLCIGRHFGAAPEWRNARSQGRDSGFHELPPRHPRFFRQP